MDNNNIIRTCLARLRLRCSFAIWSRSRSGREAPRTTSPPYAKRVLAPPPPRRSGPPSIAICCGSAAAEPKPEWHPAWPKYLYLYLIYTAHGRGGSSGGTAWRGRLGRTSGAAGRPFVRVLHQADGLIQWHDRSPTPATVLPRGTTKTAGSYGLISIWSC
jgi:hypothetical protein